jgi:hypothetical protein
LRKKSFFNVYFNLMAFVGLPLGRMSTCCSMKRRVTLSLVHVKALKKQWKYHSPNLWYTFFVPHTLNVSYFPFTKGQNICLNSHLGLTIYIFVDSFVETYGTKYHVSCPQYTSLYSHGSSNRKWRLEVKLRDNTKY